MLLIIPQEACLSLIVSTLRTPLPVPNAEQTDVKTCHWPWAQIFTVKTAKEFGALICPYIAFA